MCALSASRSLPYYPSPLVGREAETALLLGLIADPNIQLITITGTAGVGKTRLSAHLLRSVERTAEDVNFISLATVREPDLVISEIGRSLGLQGDDLGSSIRDHLSTLSGVLVLDNVEQVIEAAPDIAEIQPQNPDFTIVVTSQRPLHIDGERVVRLAPLAVPPTDTDLSRLRTVPSVKLLLDRAIDQDATLEEALCEASTASAVAEICRRLDGIPLALELAASRISSLSPEAVLAQLEQDQSILSTQRRDAPERQRTMHAAISWSFSLLPPDLQRVFLWLGAFTAGFSLDIVGRLSDHLQDAVRPVDVVSELMNLSLVQRVSGGANPWYSMLVSIRQFCLAELDATGERARAEAFVTDYVLEMAAATEETLTGPKSAEWMQTITVAFPTVRSSVAWALAHKDPKVPTRVSFGMWRFMEKDGRWQELVSWVDQAMEWRDRLSDEDLIRGLLAKLTAQEDARDVSGALLTSQEAGALLEGKDLPELQLLYLLRAGALEHDQQHLDAAEGLFYQAADLAEHLGRRRDSAMAFSNLGLLAFQRGDLENAEQKIRQTINLLRELGDTLGVVSSLSNLGALLLQLNELEEARVHLEEALEISRDMGLTRDLVYLLLNYASLLSELYEQSDNDVSLLDATEATLHESIEHAQRIAYPVLEAYGAVGLAKVAVVRENFPASGEFINRAIELASPTDNPRQYPPLGLVTAELSAAIGNWRISAAIVEKARSYAEETDYILEHQELVRLAELDRAIDENLEDPGAARARGVQWSTEEFVRQLSMAARRAAHPSAGILVKVGAEKIVDQFTPRENEILELLIVGESTQSMADSLSLSPRTVTTHIGNMMSKMGVSSRTELMAKALQARK